MARLCEIMLKFSLKFYSCIPDFYSVSKNAKSFFIISLSERRESVVANLLVSSSP